MNRRIAPSAKCFDLHLSRPHLLIVHSLMTLIALGSNVFGNLDPTSQNEILSPTDITVKTGCEKVIWHSFTLTVGRDKFVYTLDGRRSKNEWNDVVVTGLGGVYAWYKDSIYMCDQMEAFLEAAHDEPTLTHPLLATSKGKLYAAESRVFLVLDGPAQHLFEIDHGDLRQNAAPRLRLIEEFEGLRFTFISGTRNRFGVVTEAGDFYLIDTRSKDPELVELAEEVRLAGVGSRFEVVVTETKVLTRDLNLGETEVQHSPTWVEVDIDPKSIQAIHTSRSTVIFDAS
ncbi:hypothetical protein BD324DRAFT_5466 [Kockovaella imperatae]|uniref:Uncharacterized protein n=1 Tax=Kockovaella imperatae TaxID=4999 RepID=A0A1Y1URE9_9TREE|nr:hypothetical protein BD324DRAFT_5466 [Kockovaella imperatae]ORX40512.1 hypothetical protein BD324DRAFT_5466 [Kockovaella imperatae]